MRMSRTIAVIVGVMCCFGCTDSSPVQPDTRVPASSIERLQIYVRGWPIDEVELDMNVVEGQRRLILYRPARDGQPELLLASISPDMKEWENVDALLQSYDVWELANPDAPGAACRTYKGQPTCNPTFNDYSIAMRVIVGGVTRNQRYTRLDGDNSAHVARAMGDFVLAWAREREGSTQPSITTIVLDTMQTTRTIR